MTTPAFCAICGGSDRFAVGVCAACAASGRDWQLLMVRPALDRGAQNVLEVALREWAGGDVQPTAIAETARGRQALAVVPAAISLAAEREMNAAGIATQTMPLNHWPRVLPPSFVGMLAAVAVAGSMAGRVSTTLLVTTPLLVALLLVAAWLHLKKPLLTFQRSKPALPAIARNALASALAELPAGRPRDLVHDLARVAEQTYASLPDAFRRAALGQSVVELVNEAGPLGIETMRLERVAHEMGTPGNAKAAAALAQLQSAIQARLQLLIEARTLLARIATDRLDLEDGVATEVRRLVDQLRAEQQWSAEGERTVAALTL